MLYSHAVQAFAEWMNIGLKATSTLLMSWDILEPEEASGFPRAVHPCARQPNCPLNVVCSLPLVCQTCTAWRMLTLCVCVCVCVSVPQAVRCPAMEKMKRIKKRLSLTLRSSQTIDESLSELAEQMTIEDGGTKDNGDDPTNLVFIFRKQINLKCIFNLQQETQPSSAWWKVWCNWNP